MQLARVLSRMLSNKNIRTVSLLHRTGLRGWTCKWVRHGCVSCHHKWEQQQNQVESWQGQIQNVKAGRLLSLLSNLIQHAHATGFRPRTNVRLSRWLYLGQLFHIQLLHGMVRSVTGFPVINGDEVNLSCGPDRSSCHQLASFEPASFLASSSSAPVARKTTRTKLDSLGG